MVCRQACKMKTEQIPEDFSAWIKARTFEIGSFEWRTSLEVALTSFGEDQSGKSAGPLDSSFLEAFPRRGGSPGVNPRSSDGR
jgi:hypothetical protein